MRIQLGDVIGPGPLEEGDRRLYRVLAIDNELDAIWWISLGGFDHAKKKVVPYMTGPRRQSLSAVTNWLTTGERAIKTVSMPANWVLDDVSFKKTGKTDKENARREECLKERDERWAKIEPLVEGRSTQQLAPRASSMRNAIKKRALETKTDITTIYSLIHLYWAHGSVRNALMTNRANCGGPGKRRKQTKRIGRKSRAEKAGALLGSPYILQDGDHEKLAKGYTLIGRRMSVHRAYVLTMGAFWSEIKLDDNKRPMAELLPIHERPTQCQFEYWGKILNTPEDKQRRNASGRWRGKSQTRRGGSVQDQVVAVGQMGMIDGTSTDVYLTSWKSRLIKLPPMTRCPLMDVGSTVLVGFYSGWDAPSPATAMQAILCGAESKAELCERFDIPFVERDWPCVLFRLVLADNGEMKAAHITEAEKQFGFSVEYVKSYSGESKGSIESQHHRDHKALDHRIEGTTFGKQRERGEEHAANNALWNYWEYMREQLLDYLAYNKEEAKDIAPLEMIAAGIKPTRINIFHWLREHGHDAGIPVDIEQLRAFTLPDWPAVIRKDGVFLLTRDGTKIVPRVRFFSDALTQDHRYRTARAKNVSIRVGVKSDPQDFGKVWLPSESGLMRLPNVQSEPEFIRELTMTDWMDSVECGDITNEVERGDKEQLELDRELRQTGINERGKKQVAAEIKALGKKPSKASIKKNLLKNKELEKSFIASGGVEPPITSENGSGDLIAMDQADDSAAASEAMDNFLKESAP